MKNEIKNGRTQTSRNEQIQHFDLTSDLLIVILYKFFLQIIYKYPFVEPPKTLKASYCGAEGTRFFF